MRIIQSFWSLPTLTGDRTNVNERFNGGWPEYKYNLFCWALSCLNFGKYYDLGLITDSHGKNLLSNELGLPYQKVTTDLEDSFS